MRYDLPSSANTILNGEHNFAFSETVHAQQQETSVSLPPPPPPPSLVQDVSMDSYPSSALDGYNDYDDHFLPLDVADLSNYMTLDPTDPTNMFQSPLFLSDSLATTDTAIALTAGVSNADASNADVGNANGGNANASPAHGAENLGVDFQGWPCFACNPSSGEKVHLKTGRTFLEGLEHILKDHDTVHSSPFLPVLKHDGEHAEFDDAIRIEPFNSRARDKLMVIMQSILHRARKIHGPRARDRLESHPDSPQDSSSIAAETFSILPPTDHLERLLQAYAHRFEPYYASVPSRLLSPTGILNATEQRCSALLLLLMFAQGAMATATDEARYLTSGLTEACRLSWFSLVEKDVSLSMHPTMLRSALMFINLAAWSGVKWHMDLATAQLDMYTSMLRHSGLLAYREKAPRQGANAVDADWKSWKDYECGNRLAHSWVVVDQELSLFHDKAPKLSIAELSAAMPDQDILWNATTAEDWSRAYNNIYKSPEASVAKNPPSLKHVFRRFMNRDPLIQSLDFSATQLRLFLQPLQAMVCHLHECLDYFLDGGNDRRSQRLITQLEEVQSILQDWYSMCSRSSMMGMTTAASFHPAMCANLVTYHLISLNTMTHFREMEGLARGELPREEFRRSYWTRVRCVEEAGRIWLHCGQVLRLVRLMPEARQPAWWPAAIYRVAIIMWATSTANMLNATSSSRGGTFSLSADEDTIRIDNLAPEHPSILRYLRYREGVPVLSKLGGGVVSLEVPRDTLKHCLDLLSEGPTTTRLAEGIQWTLSAFIAREGEKREMQ